MDAAGAGVEGGGEAEVGFILRADGAGEAGELGVDVVHEQGGAQ